MHSIEPLPARVRGGRKSGADHLARPRCSAKIHHARSRRATVMAPQRWCGLGGRGWTMRSLEMADLPVLAAPMAGGPTTPALVAAASAAGSLGFLPAGYRTAPQLATDLETVRVSTPAFGVNLFVPDRRPIDRAAVTAYRDAIAAEV